MIRCLALLLVASTLGGCAAVLPTVHVANASTASFLARGTPEAVLDTLEARFRPDPCLSVSRGRDSLGADSLAVEHGCSGAPNRAVLHVRPAGDGLVSGRVRSVFLMTSPSYVDLSGRVIMALTESTIPTYVAPTEATTDAGCETFDDWLVWSAEPRPRIALLEGVPDEQAPELIGGLAGLAASIRYPGEARRNGVEGRTLVRFVVDETGAVTCPEAFVSQSPLLDRAAIAAVRAARFTPGTQDGRPVKVRYTVPILFTIR